MSDITVMVIVALVLAIALVGMVTRLVVPLARALWARQVRDAKAQIVVLQSLRLPRSHRRSKFRRAA